MLIAAMMIATTKMSLSIAIIIANVTESGYCYTCSVLVSALRLNDGCSKAKPPMCVVCHQMVTCLCQQPK